jgi:hypothetical protein
MAGIARTGASGRWASRASSSPAGASAPWTPYAWPRAEPAKAAGTRATSWACACAGPDRETYIGAIRLPGDGLVLGRELTSFVEIYGGPITPDRVPALTITFGNHRADGQPIPMRKASAYHDSKFPLRAQAAAIEKRSVRITLSPTPVSGSRHYGLWGN